MHDTVKNPRVHVGFAAFLFALAVFLIRAWRMAVADATNDFGETDGLLLAQLFVVSAAKLLILFSILATALRAALIKAGVIKGNIIR